ncbi:MAG: chemotaxis response regulator protein-glutamate methylesterase [Candidatus Accumulibacter sp.]|jgi:two-component system chemotaxis response regulator CheB|nr:chemotaxis response regulator protein-glutamate methylesterase [Accumulibacter sp.]
MADKIKVMIVDDSALVRKVFSQILAHDPAIEVIATAPDPLAAQEMMKSQWPDVLILDIEMPRMDGLTFLRQLMREHPTPAIICSHLTAENSKSSVEALAAGAISIIAKPLTGVKQFLEDSDNNLIHAIHTAARANLKAALPHFQGKTPPPAATARAHASIPPAHPPLDRPYYNADVILPPARSTAPSNAAPIIAIGASTGGVQALEALLPKLPAATLGIVVVQHMPANFTAIFSSRLDGMCQVRVSEARSGDCVRPGHALVAPGGKHLLVRRSGTQHTVEVLDGPPVNRHKPSVDVLFRSVAQAAGRKALGIILTGMGDDGARGLKEMHDAGAKTIAQNEASCVVFGMPREAIKMGVADQVAALGDIPTAIAAYCRGMG